MIVGVGLDLVEIDRAERALQRWGSRLLCRLMDPAERATLPAPGPQRDLALARAIAAKEAASKAIGTGWSRGVSWRDVVLVPGSPESIQLQRRALEVARGLGWDGRSQVRFKITLGMVVGEVRLLGSG